MKEFAFEDYLEMAKEACRFYGRKLPSNETLRVWFETGKDPVKETNPRIVNLTPHEVVIFLEEETLVIPTSGAVARVVEELEYEGEVFGIPAYSKKLGEVIDLPESEYGNIYLVSAMVAEAAKREDVYVPNDFVRDSAGRITGCKSLCCSAWEE